MNYPKIFVINLKRSVDRRKHMEKILSEIPMEVEFVEAIDAKQLSDKEISQVYDDEACKKNINRSLSKPEIACFLSHIKTWKLIQKQSLQDVFIMEDDIIIKNKEIFLEILKNRNKFPKDWELVLFAHGNSRITNIRCPTSSFLHKKKILKQYKIVRFMCDHYFILGTLGYLINHFGIYKLLKKTKRIQGTIDDYYTNNDKIVNLYGIEPVIIEEHEDFGKNSLITDSREEKREENKTKPSIYIPTKMDNLIDKIELILNFLKILKFTKFIYHKIFFKYIYIKTCLKLKRYKIPNLKEKK